MLGQLNCATVAVARLANPAKSAGNALPTLQPIAPIQVTTALTLSNVRFSYQVQRSYHRQMRKLAMAKSKLQQLKHRVSSLKKGTTATVPTPAGVGPGPAGHMASS
jgi:hypothetical protein